MVKNLALKIIMWISIVGILFSGHLSYTELIKEICPIGGCSLLFGLPVCVYGFVMYMAVFVISVLGIKGKL